MTTHVKNIVGISTMILLFCSLFAPLFFTVIEAKTPDQAEIGIQQNQVSLDDVNGLYSKGTAALESSQLTIKVAAGGQNPFFHFWPTGNNTTVYHAKFVHLIEYKDTGDGAFQNYEEKSAVFAFPSATWNFSGFYNLTENDDIVGFGFNFTMSNFNRQGFSREWGGLHIEIMNRFYLHDVTTRLQAGDESATFNVSGLAALKTDVKVENWSFEDYDNMLALRWDISQSGAQHHGRHRHRVRNRVGGQNVDFGKQMQHEKKVEAPKGKKQVAVGFNPGEGAQGKFKAPNVVKLRNRTRNEVHERLREAHMSYRTDGGKLRFFMSANATNGTILYDPIFEVTKITQQDRLLENPILWLGIGITVVATIAAIAYVKRSGKR